LSPDRSHVGGAPPDGLHLPRSASIDAYGNGGFRFDEMSHRGSLLCLPNAIWAWPVSAPDEITEASLFRVFEQSADIDTLLIGTGGRHVAGAGEPA
jgi:uncharacterized protein